MFKIIKYRSDWFEVRFLNYKKAIYAFKTYREARDWAIAHS